MRKISIIVISVAFFIFITWTTFTVKFLSWDFRNNLWAPANLIWHGESAYNIKSVFSDSNAVWFPQIIGLFSPLGLLSQQLATNIWLIQNMVILLTFVWLLFRQVIPGKPNPLHLGSVILAVFLFPPTIRHLILGQADVVIAASIILGVVAIERNQIAISGFLFAIALAKPQLCVLVLPSLAIYFIIQKRAWLDMVKLFLAIFFFAAAMTVPLWFSNSHWVNDFILNLQRNPTWAQPNMFSILNNRLGMPGLAIWFFLYIASLVLSSLIWMKCDPKTAVLWVLALTTIVSPYIWSWDFVLLIPIFVDTAIRLSNIFARLTFFIFYLASFSLTLINLQPLGDLGTALWIFPVLLISGIVLSIQINRRSGVFDKPISTNGFRVDV